MCVVVCMCVRVRACVRVDVCAHVCMCVCVGYGILVHHVYTRLVRLLERGRGGCQGQGGCNVFICLESLSLSFSSEEREESERQGDEEEIVEASGRGGESLKE